MRKQTSLIAVLCVCWATSAFATDAPDFNTFYSLYKTATSQNDITVTNDLVATRLLSVPGAETTVINGGGFAFNGGAFDGFTISRDYTFSISNAGTFNVTDESVQIEKSYNNFARTPQGGVIANLGGSVNIVNSAFSGNVSSYGGGVLYQNDNGNANISNSVFDSNRATRGDGGVLYNEYETTSTFTNTVFQNNSAPNGYGGVAFNDGTLNISDSLIVSNSASGGGAGLYNSNTMNLTNVRFINNTSTESAGAVYSTGMMNLTAGIFENNSGDTGGAIGNYGIIGDTLFAQISDSRFSGNSATYGGAIYNWDDIYIIDSVFENNTATDNGGAIFNLAQLYLIANQSDIVFSGNKLNSGQSNAVHTTDIMNINASSDKSVIFNDAITGGGQIIINQPYIFNTQNVPTGGRVVLNSDMSGFVGDVIIHNGTLELSDGGKFFTADNLSVYGGVLDIGSADVSVGAVKFANNGTLRLSVVSPDVYGTLSGTSFDIASTAMLDVILSPDAMDGTDYLRVQLVRGDSAINDMFNATINNNIYEFLQLGNGWYEISQVATFADVIAENGGTQNNLVTATAWQSEPPTSHALEYAIYSRMGELVQNNAGEYIKALSALAPTSAPLIHVLSSSYINRFSELMGGADKQEYSIGHGKLWASGFGSGAHLNSDGQYADFDMYGFGGAVGAEYAHNGFTLGAAYTYQYDRLKSWARTIHTPTHGGGLYAKYVNNNFIFQAYGAMFYSKMNETKNVAGFQVGNNAPLYTYGLWSDVGYRFGNDNWAFTPRGGVRYALAHRGESSDDAGQTLLGSDLHFLTTYADVAIARYNLWTGATNIIPEITLGASYDLRSDADDAHIRINNASYTITGTTLPRWAAHAELKMRAILTPITELEFGAGVELRRDYHNYNVRLRGMLRF